jgi:aryl-alcohol dehydrogenase-like predicted oxidoreductase
VSGRDAIRRRLGRDGPEVSPMGVGCMDMSQFYGPRDDAESIATIRRALELGVDFFDTADMYGPHHNEELLRRALGDRRSGVVISTKFGNVKDDAGRVVGVNGRPEYVRSACEGSLRRLGTDHIDVYFQHRVDRSTPIEETWGAMSALVSEGKVRYLGICEAAPGTIARAHATHPMVAVQDEYSLLSRDPDRLLPLLRELGIGLVAYAPLCRGLLTAELTGPERLAEDDFRRLLPRFQPESFAHNRAVVARLQEVADACRCTLAQLALAWVLSRGDDVVPIAGTKRRTRLSENLAALDVVLTPDDLARIEAVAPPGVAAGDRYPDMSTVGV